MQPQSPNRDFDFILKDKQQSRRMIKMPNLPKPMLISLAVLFALILIAIIGSVLSSSKNSKWQPFIGVMARGSETLRVTAVAQQLQLQDPQTQALAATVNISLSSDQQQLKNYLAKNHVKISAPQLSADTDKAADATLQSASQNNGLDSAYIAYVKEALTKYQADLQKAFPGSGPNGRVILGDSIESTRALLESAPVKS